MKDPRAEELGLKEFSTVISFEQLGSTSPDGKLFDRFYRKLEEIATAVGFRFDYFGCSGQKCSPIMRKTFGKAFRVLKDRNFEALSGLYLYAVFPGSAAPAYDTYNQASLMFLKSFSHCTRCTVALNEKHLRLDTFEADMVIRSLGSLANWDYGYAYRWAVNDGPIFQALGASNGKLPARELKATTNWNLANETQRRSHLKDVFLYNFLNETQLKARVSESVELSDYIDSESSTNLSECDVVGLKNWIVPESQLSRIRTDLGGSPILITNCDVLANH